MIPQARFVTLLGATGQIRREIHDGREHIVVPIVALVEGVIHPVNAPHPELVRAACFRASVDAWEGRPTMAGHPMRGREPLSVTDNAELLRESFGFTSKPTADEKRLCMEAWLDPTKMTHGHPAQILDAVTSEPPKPLEVSVGVFTAMGAAEGVWTNGKKYKGDWLSLKPDHLALFANGQKGACSVEMGCGLPRVAMRVAADGQSIELEEGFTIAGDVPGHEFHGNQYTHGSASSDHEKARDAHKEAHAANETAAKSGATAREKEIASSKSSKALELSQKANTSTRSIKDKGMTRVQGESEEARRSAEDADRATGESDNPTSHDFARAAHHHKSAMISHRNASVSHQLKHKHKRDAAENEGGLMGRFATLFRSLMPRGWGDDEVKQELRDALLAAEPAFRNGDILRVKNDVVVYCLYPPPPAYYEVNSAYPAPMTYWQRAYTFDTTTQKFSVSAERQQVEPTTHYEPYRASEELPELPEPTPKPCTCGNHAAAAAGEDTMKREERIAALVANPHSPVKSLKMLEAATDEELTQIEATAGTLKAAADKTAQEAADKQAADKKTADEKAAADLKAAAAANAPIAETEEQVLARFPSIKSVVESHRAAQAKQRSELVTSIRTASQAFTESDLNAMSIEQLMKLATLAKVPAPKAVDYSGMGMPRAAAAVAGDLASFAPPDPYAAPKTVN